MKNKSKILLRVAIVILVLTLISTLVLSTVYAKYVSTGGFNDPLKARPAMFELVMNSDSDDELVVNFAADGEPGAPIGFSEFVRDYDFTVKMEGSEVASECYISIIFNDEIQELINKARDDKFSYGTSCAFELYRGTKNGENIVYETMILTSDILTSERNDLPIFEAVETVSVEPSKVQVGEVVNVTKYTWTANSIVVNPHKNPDEPESGVAGHYRLRMIFYNNTLMPEPDNPVTDENGVTHTSNTNYYVFSSDAIEIEVTAKQLDPEYAGSGYTSTTN